MKRIRQNRLEWALLGLIALVCTALSILQYRWTGEVSRAERTRLRSGLSEQAGRLARAFDAELRESLRTLLPDLDELRQKGIEEAHRLRYQRWASVHDRNLLGRIGVAVPDHGTLKLYGMDKEGRISSTEWPASWQTLRDGMIARMQGIGQAPAVPLHSTLVELPVFDSTEGRGDRRTEMEWMILEVSEDHLRAKILPALVAEYLGAGNDAVYDISVGWVDTRDSVVFSTRADKSSVASGADFATGMFSRNIAATGERQRRGGREGARPRWTLSIRHRAGSLDAAVSRARTRNFVTSLILIGVLAGAASALVRYTARSRRLAEMQFRFAAGVSHDLRTPLTAIRGAAFNLVDGLVTDPAGIQRYASLILRNSEELTSMIENVLAFSATMHSRTQQQHETFAVGDLLDHAAAAMGPEIEQAGCRLEVNVAPDLPPVAGDPVALELAFRNLIGNAVRHASQGKWIGVSAARRAGAIEIRVSDRGPGIPESECHHVFEPFYRGERTRAAQVRGTGLGLSLVKETVERHQGTITLQNSPAGGAQFTVRLPALSEEA